MSLIRRFRDASLFWKLLLPFAALVVLIGAVGLFLTVRSLSTQAQAKLDQELLRDSLEARSYLHDREFYLLEAANLAANLEGMHAAVAAGDAGHVERLTRSVVALKQDLDQLVIVRPEGDILVGFERSAAGAEPRVRHGGVRPENALVRRAIEGGDGSVEVGIVERTDGPMLATAAPICATPDTCRPAGVAVAELELTEILRSLLAPASPEPPGAGPEAGVAMHDNSGRSVASVGLPATRPPAGVARQAVRVRSERAGRQIDTLHAPFRLGDSVAGHLSVSRPTEAAFASVRTAGWWLALLVLLGMAGVFGVGWALSRSLLRQVRPLVSGNRAFGQGDLSSRVPVVSGDELGELAAGFNQMADQIQASYETLESRVTERTEEIRRLLEQRTEFFTSVSHEFRTALAVIRGEAELLKDPTYARGPRERAEIAATLAAASSQLRSFVDDVLEVARAEAGGLEIETEELDAARLLADLRPAARSLARAGDLKIAFRVPERLPRVQANATRVRDIVLGLIDNATKYTPSGGRLEVAAWAKNGEVRLSVSDDGPGIPPDVGDHVFDAFYRVKGTQQLRGQTSSGLGLAIAKHAVEAQGGRIWFESTLGEGTTFTVALPVARARRRRPKRSTSTA